MNLDELRDLSATLVKIANAPMADAAYTLHQLRLNIHEKIIRLQKQTTHGERVEARQKQNG